MAKISILMSVHNNEKTVSKSIDCMLAQTCTDWELLLCDDGSSDGTAAVLEAYAARDTRMKVISNRENRGLAYSLNRCLELAGGEYCARMDGDDLCEPDRLEKELSFLEQYPQYGFVSTTMKRFDEKGFYSIPKTGEPYEPTLFDYVKGSPFCHAPAMIRTEAYRRVGGYRDLPQTRQMEDYDLWFRLLAKGIHGCILQEPLYSMFDGRDAVHRRTYRRRINEAWVRWQGYQENHVPLPWRIFVLKPLILGLVPAGLLQTIKRKRICC